MVLLSCYVAHVLFYPPNNWVQRRSEGILGPPGLSTPAGHLFFAEWDCWEPFKKWGKFFCLSEKSAPKKKSIKSHGLSMLYPWLCHGLSASQQKHVHHLRHTQVGLGMSGEPPRGSVPRVWFARMWKSAFSAGCDVIYEHPIYLSIYLSISIYIRHP